MPLGYEIDLYDATPKPGGYMRQQIPSFRLPESVIDEECGYILDMGVTTFFNHRVESMKALLDQEYDSVFVGTGARVGEDFHCPIMKQLKVPVCSLGLSGLPMLRLIM